MVLLANPLSNPAAWNVVLVAGVANPGVARIVDGGNRPYKWDVKDTAGAQGGTTTYRGFKNSEHLRVRYEFWTREQIDQFYAEYYPLLKYDALKTAPKPVAISHPALAANDITTVVTNDIGALLDLGGQLWSVTVEFIEYRPPKKQNVTTTPNGAATSSSKSNQPSVEDAQDRQIAKLLEQWNKPLPARS